MKFTSERERILEPLQAVIGVVERRQTMPILANVLLSAKNGRLAVTATDLEVELVAAGEVPGICLARVTGGWLVRGRLPRVGWGRVAQRVVALRDGRIVELREFMDSFDAVEQVLGREIEL